MYSIFLFLVRYLLTTVFENVSSRFQEPKERLDDRTETMLKIYEDSTIAKENQDRCSTVVFLHVKQKLTRIKDLICFTIWVLFVA